MDELLKYRLPFRERDLHVGIDSMVLAQTFVEESLRGEERRDDGLNAFRGAVNGILISLAFWITIILILFRLF
jgi:hypothetical protein